MRSPIAKKHNAILNKTKLPTVAYDRCKTKSVPFLMGNNAN